MEANPLTKKRLDELDIIKGIAIVFVFLRHLNEITGASALYTAAEERTYLFFEAYMILFFLCSGYVYKSKGTALQEICKRAKQLLLPFLKFGLAATAVYFLRYVIIEHKPLLWFADNTLTNFLGLTNWNVRLGKAQPNQMEYAFVACWFLLEMFPAFCVFIPVKKLTDQEGLAARVAAAAGLMAIAMVLNFFDPQGTVTDTYNSPVPFFLVLINVFGFAAVLMIGSILKELNAFDLDDVSPKVKFSLAAVCFVFDSALVLLYKNGYALQYGKWGPYGAFSIPLTILDGLMLTYFLVFLAHYMKKVSILKTIYCFLGKNSLYILLLHIGVAECICWIGGFWYDVYAQPFPVEDFRAVNWWITILGTAAVLAVFFTAKERMERAARK